MAELLILVPPCIALMAPVMSPAFSVSVVLALAVTQSILTIFLCLQVWNMKDDDEEAGAGAGTRADDEYEYNAVIEDATNIVHATFAAFAKSPGATSTSFQVVQGSAIHQHSTAGALKHSDGVGRLNGIGPEEVYSGCRYNSATDGAKLEYWPDFCDKHYTMSNSSSCKGYAGFRKLCGIRISVRHLGGADLVAQMV